MKRVLETLTSANDEKVPDNMAAAEQLVGLCVCESHNVASLYRSKGSKSWRSRLRSARKCRSRSKVRFRGFIHSLILIHVADCPVLSQRS